MELVDKLYAMTDKGPLRGLSLVLALVLAFCVFWDPSRFAAKTSQLEIWHGLLIMWAVCTGVIFGVGFRFHRSIWRLFFLPLPALLILVAGLIYFFR